MGEVLALKAINPPSHAASARARRGRFGRLRASQISAQYDADVRHLREIIGRESPVGQPRGACGRHFSTTFDLMEALALYCLVVELEYQQADVARQFGRSTSTLKTRIGRIEELRDQIGWIDRLCLRIRETGHVLL